MLMPNSSSQTTASRRRLANAHNGGDIMSRTSLAGSGEADIESSTSGHDDGHNEETHTMPAILVALPEHLLVLASEWLFVKDLLTLRAVDRNFHAISKNQTLWKGMARHLWRAALVGRADDGYGLLDNCDARLQHQEKDNADGLTLEDVCRCMVGAWPTYIDFSEGPSQTGSEAVHRVVDGAVAPIQPRRKEHRSQNESNGEDEPRQVPPEPGAAAVSAAWDAAGGGQGGSGHEACKASTGRSHRVARKRDGKDRPARALCTTVVFCGGLGGDRAVRADAPFPWMDDPDGEGWRHDTLGLAKSPGAYFIKTRRRCLRYPHAFVAHVLSRSPFATLWPGHHPPERRDYGGVDAGGSEAEKSSKRRAEAKAEAEAKDRLRGKCLTSSGPDPFFHVGLIAYYEITIGESMGPASKNAVGRREQCVAIGLATDTFRLGSMQPGWDPCSWGFHSDDGFFIHQNHAHDLDNPNKFGPGDTVGCALVYEPLYSDMFSRYLTEEERQKVPSFPYSTRNGAQGGIFFTKNGRYLGVAFGGVASELPLYPVVGLDSHYPVEFNFGTKAFAFDLPAFEAHVLDHIATTSPFCAPSLGPKAAAIRTHPNKHGRLVNPRLVFPYLRLDDKADDSSDSEQEDDVDERRNPVDSNASSNSKSLRSGLVNQSARFPFDSGMGFLLAEMGMMEHVPVYDSDWDEGDADFVDGDSDMADEVDEDGDDEDYEEDEGEKEEAEDAA